MESAFFEMADRMPAMLWHTGPDRRCNWFNRGWLEFAGRDLACETGDGWAERLHPDDHAMCIDAFAGAFDERRPFALEYRMRRHDGEYRWLHDRGAPYQRGGRFGGYWGHCTDVTAHRKTEHDQRVLIGELTHRVKNTLAMVQAMAMQSFRDGRSLDDGMEVFEARLQAMAAAHDLLVTKCWNDVPLDAVIGSAIAPHDPGRARICVEGPPLMIPPRLAMSIAMVVHELLTNATKYGALSAPGGRVALGWSSDEGMPGGRLLMHWKESGGPPVSAPDRRGFGTRFIERALAGHAGAVSSLAFEPDGVLCHFATGMA